MDVYNTGQTLQIIESVMAKDSRLLQVTINETVNFVMLDPSAVGYILCKNEKGQKGLRLFEENR